MTKQELSQKVKAKYPEYQNIDDNELADKIIAKYPVYQSQITEQPEQKQTLLQKTGDVLTGVGKGALSTFKGISSLGEKTLGRVVGAYKGGKTSAEQVITDKYTQPTNTLQSIGKTGEQIAEFAIPGGAVSKATKGLSVVPKLLSRAATSGAIATAQEGNIGKGTAIAAGTELALPIVGKAIKPVTGVIGRLLTGLGAGLSGASSDELKTILSNPKTAQQISKQLATQGRDKIVESNAKTIMNGISKINKNASDMYKAGLDSLKSTDIKPEIIAKNSLSALEKNKISVTQKGFDLSNSDIISKPIQNKANKLLQDIGKINITDGKKVSEVMRKLESSKFLKSQDPDRMAFNSLLDDLHNGLKNSINESTNKLNEINAKYTTAKNLSSGIQQIFGKVKYKNATELNTIAKNLNNLFSQKGLDEKTVNEFMKEIGQSPEKLKTSQSVLRLSGNTTKENTKGLSWSEISQQVTSSFVTPNAIKNIAIATGLSKNVIKNIVKHTAPAGRAVIIKSLINQNK